MTYLQEPAFSLLSDDDAYLFAEGTHLRLYRQFGAHPVRAGQRGARGVAARDGTYFAVWAPNASRVAVMGDWNQWRPDQTSLTARGTTGIWEVFVPGAAVGSLYKYVVTDRQGRSVDKCDPVAFAAEHPPGTASRIWQSELGWSDSDWIRNRRNLHRAAAPISIYEVHLGSWRRSHGQFLGYRELGVALAEHVGRLGFTHVELLPVMEHPFYGSWGYQVTGYFAPTARYGTADDLKAMIDGLHRRGIGVILDWVPAHFPTDAHALGDFDGTHLYEHDDPRRGFHPDWKSYIFNYARNEVRSFLLSSAMYWIEELHADGLRVDGVASMLYRDYSRKEGEWVPEEDGSNRDRAAERFLQQLNVAVRETYPDVLMIAEESTAWPGVTRAPEVGGLGFTYKWDMGWMHDTLAYMREDPLYRKHHHGKMTFRAMYAQSERFVLPLSHDEVVHGKGALLAKCAGDRWQRLATLRTLYAYQWTTPGKKLLFQGGELAVADEWDHDRELDWRLAESPEGAGMMRWISDLNTAYRGQGALHRGDHLEAGFRWLVVDDQDHSVFAYARLGDDRDPPVVVVLSFTPVVRSGYLLPVPKAGRWMEILCSDSAVYGGSNVSNAGPLDTEPLLRGGGAAAGAEPTAPPAPSPGGEPARGAGGDEVALRVTLPPLGAIVLVLTDGAAQQ